MHQESFPTEIPLGFKTLYAACRHIYPDQPDPLHVSPPDKYWQGGPTPLDCVNIYSNPGNPASNIEPHWHYISFGLSDLHGDGRVHKISGSNTPCGYGLELTFRLKRKPNECVPPKWPAHAHVMGARAQEIFRSALWVGDQACFHHSSDTSKSRIQHVLTFEDPQLGTVKTQFGPVTFIQIAGVCTEELEAAKRWRVPDIIKLMKSVKGAGGPWLITDMRRDKTIFELDSSVQEAMQHSDTTVHQSFNSWICQLFTTSCMRNKVKREGYKLL